jgi:serine/threonine protein kinase/tetratricopeptide (TPR) repeat protein
MAERGRRNACALEARQGLFAGRFFIEHEAGAGGMGVVYRAVDRTSGRTVALKVLHRIDANTLRRFAVEAETLGKVAHPQVVRYLAHGVSSNGEPYLAMEWVDGETLSTHLARRRKGGLTVEEVVRLGLGLARALEAAHAYGIVHRDVKPSNVLLAGGQLERPTLADFGVARPPLAPSATATTSGVIVGTIGYMAPEHARGVLDLDGRADIFSLGCLLFRCLTATDAFAGPEALTVLAKSVLEDPRRARELRRDVPPELDALVARMLSKDREQRPESARAVGMELARILEGLPRLAPGARFGRYVLRRALGHGEIGQTFLADDGVLERQVALELLHREHPQAMAVVRRARGIAALSHPNVVTVYEVGEEDGVAFVAMEHLAGRPLLEHARERRAAARERIAWLSQLGTALAHLHRAGWVHGDLRAAHLTVTDGGTLKLTDLGGAGSADARADQRAWACIAQELLATSGPPGDVPEIVRRATDASFVSMDALVRALQPPRHRRWRWAWASALPLAAAALLSWKMHHTSVAAATVPLPAPMALADLPIAPACKPAAVALYRQGLASFHQGNWNRAHEAFVKADGEDPSCPQVQMRLAITGAAWQLPLAKVHEQLLRANSLRHGLTERDRVLLDAWAMMVERATPGNEEALRILDAGLVRFPDDAELLVHAAGRVLHVAPSEPMLEGALQRVVHALDIDPGYADAWQLKGQILGHLGRFDEELAAVDRCLVNTPDAADCITDRILILRRLGRCGEAAGDARRLVTVDSESAASYRLLALSLASAGAPHEDVERVLEQRWEHVSESKRGPTRIWEQSRWAAFTGDFAKSMRLSEQLEREAVGPMAGDEHIRATNGAVDALLEMGQAKRAGAIAASYLRRRDAWLHQYLTGVGAAYSEPLLLATELRGGVLSPAEWRTAADAWEQANERRLDSLERWVLRWGAAMGSGITAAEAFARAPDMHAASRLRSPNETLHIGVLDGYRGRLHLEQGDAAAAVPLLERATRSCQGFDLPYLNVQARLWLGEAKEKLGQTDGACSEYAEVQARWGNAKPISITAREAARRQKALGCKRR